jgi:hypothetical protein
LDLTFVSAGHDPALLMRAGGRRRLRPLRACVFLRTAVDPPPIAGDLLPRKRIVRDEHADPAQEVRPRAVVGKGEIDVLIVVAEVDRDNEALEIAGVVVSPAVIDRKTASGVDAVALGIERVLFARIDVGIEVVAAQCRERIAARAP